MISPRAAHKDRDSDLAKIGTLSRPIFIVQRVLGRIGWIILRDGKSTIVPAKEAILPPGVQKAGFRYAVVIGHFTKQIRPSPAFPRADRFERWRLQRCNAPL